MAVDKALTQLKDERDRLAADLKRLDQAIALLGGRTDGRKGGMSAEARQRISDAQKARWAKQRGEANKKEIEEAMNQPKAKRGRRRKAAGA